MATTVDSILVRIDADLGDLRQELNKLDRRLEKTAKDSSRNLNAIGGAFRALGPIIATYVGGIAIKSIIDVGRQSENLAIQLGYLFNSAEEGARAFQVMSEYASQVPFSLQQIEAASQPLGAVAKDADELQQLLRLTGDVAAVTGLSFQETALQLQRSFSAGIGAADMFRDRGVTAMLGFEQGASYSVAQTIEKFEEAFGQGGKFNGAADSMADTFDGTMSMLGDSLFNFQKQIGEAGFFDALKEEASSLDEAIKTNDETVKRFAQNLGTVLAGAVRVTSRAIAEISGFFNELFNFARGLGHALATESGMDFFNLTVDELIERGAKLQARQMGIAASGEEAADAIEAQAKAAANASKSLSDLSVADSSKAAKLSDEEKAINKLIATNAKLALENAGVTDGRIKEFEILNKLTELTPVQKRQIADLTVEYDMLKREASEATEKEKALERAMALLADTAGDEAAEKIHDLNLLMAENPALTDAARLKIEELRNELDNVVPIADVLKGALEDTAQSVSDSMTEMFMSGQYNLMNLRDLVGDVVRQIIAKVIQLSVVNPIINSIFSSFGANAGLQTTTAAPSAGGGQMHPSSPRIVGERGPELFVPHSAGTLMNNMNTQNALGGQAVNVTQNLNFSLGVSDTVRAEIAGMMPIINQSAVSAVQQARTRGGSFAGAFGG